MSDFRDRVGSVTTDAMEGDNLALVLVGYFAKHPDCLEDGPLDEYECWPEWAVARTNEVLDAIADLRKVCK